MFSFQTTTKTLVLSALLSSATVATASSNLRPQEHPPANASHERKLQSYCRFLPFLCSAPANTCPVVTPLSAENFDLEKYIAKTWFVQKQQTNPYQSEDQLFCIAATYDKTEGDEFLEVSNYGNNGAVNGPVQDSGDNGFFSDLCGKQNDGGELSVAPCLFRPIFDAASGPYWVLDVADDYSWAIVSGGAPDQPRTDPANPNADLCTTKEGSNFFDTNGSGLWLFTRAKDADGTTIAAMEDKLTAMGIFTGDLKDVDQTGCRYDGATLKL